MSFNWTAYLDVAKELCGKTNGIALTAEAKSRCAISRSYYSAFCSSRNFLINKGNVIPEDGSAHMQVRQEFYNSTDQTWKQIANNLNRLRLARNKADYCNSYKGSNRATVHYEALTSLSHSESILNDLNKLSGTK